MSRAPFRTAFAFFALTSASFAAHADLNERLVRIQALDSNGEVRGCGTGYLTASKQIVTAFHVLVPPKTTLCGKPSRSSVDIIRYQIVLADGEAIEVACNEFDVIPGQPPAQDVGFLTVRGAQSALLEVAPEIIDGFAGPGEFRTNHDGAIVGYLDDVCRSGGRLEVVEQEVVLSEPRRVPRNFGDANLIVIQHPQRPGTSGSPVVWRPTGKVIGIYVGKTKLDPGSNTTEGLVSSFDSSTIRQNYTNATGRVLELQRLTPVRAYFSLNAVAGNPFGGSNGAYGGLASLSIELIAGRTVSFGLSPGLGYVLADYETHYQDPLGNELETHEGDLTAWLWEFLAELRTLRQSRIHLVFAAGLQVTRSAELGSPGGVPLDRNIWGPSARVTGELLLSDTFLARAFASLNYNSVPNTTLAYTGRGAELEFPSGASNSWKPTVLVGIGLGRHF